ncbi:hypothetical protein [Streptomyces sp. VRA16 Mangrove soil]|uniref:hypothetical protein n=1 Tax=Streptomyces sp. VRA16 Mangrove soil TaxID=2817434 RepID=UPI001E3EC609|nr:hypothetical protein [Streptomyces sp. VRA16 Mangrove soil]
MGFSGHLVFARSERPLLEAPLFGSADAGLRDSVRERRARPGGWQTLALDHGVWQDEDLCTLVARTGAPACVADVSESSIALVTGLTTVGHCWQTWLNRDSPRTFPVHGAVPRSGTAAPWSEHQPLKPTGERLQRQELFDKLLDELGFPEVAPPSSRP